MQTNHPIQARRSNLLLINIVDFAIPADHNESEIRWKDEEILRPCQRAEKAVEYENSCYNNYNRGPWNNTPDSGEKNLMSRTLKKNRNHSDYCSTKIGKDTWKCSGDPLETCSNSDSNKKPSVRVSEKRSYNDNNNGKLFLILINQKKRTCKIIDFAVPADHRIKLKECEKKDKYLDLAWELKKLWNMLVTIIPIVIGAVGTVTKRLQKGLDDLEVGGRMETIQTTTLLRTARILRRVLEIWGELLSLKLQWKTIG